MSILKRLVKVRVAVLFRPSRQIKTLLPAEGRRINATVPVYSGTDHDP